MKTTYDEFDDLYKEYRILHKNLMTALVRAFARAGKFSGRR